MKTFSSPVHNLPPSVSMNGLYTHVKAPHSRDTWFGLQRLWMLKLSSTQTLQQARSSMFQIILSTRIQGNILVLEGKEIRRRALGQGRRLRLVSLLLPQATWWHCWFQFASCSMDWGSQQPTLASIRGSCPIRNFSPGSHREISNICIAMASGSQWKPPGKTFLSPCILLSECPVFSPVAESQPSSPRAPQLASTEALTLVRASYDVWHSGKVPWVLLRPW